MEGGVRMRDGGAAGYWGPDAGGGRRRWGVRRGVDGGAEGGGGRGKEMEKEGMIDR